MQKEKFEVTGGSGNYIEMDLNGTGENHTTFERTGEHKDQDERWVIEFTEIVDTD